MGQSLDAYLAFGVLLHKGEDADEEEPWKGLTYRYQSDLVKNPAYGPENEYRDQYIHSGNFISEEYEVDDWETWFALLLDPDQGTHLPDEPTYAWKNRVWGATGLDTHLVGRYDYCAGTLLVVKNSVVNAYYGPEPLGPLAAHEVDPDWHPVLDSLKRVLELAKYEGDPPQWWLWPTYG